MWPYDGLRFVSNPTKITIGGQDKITAELEGYFIYVRKLWWGTSTIGKWYPYDPTETDNKAKIGFSALFTQGWNTSLPNRELTKLSIYPNPAQSNLTLENSDESINGWAVFDMAGKMVIQSQGEINVNRTNIDISNLSSGLYYINVRTKSSNKSLKFIKE